MYIALQLHTLSFLDFIANSRLLLMHFFNRFSYPASSTVRKEKYLREMSSELFEKVELDGIGTWANWT